MKHTYTTCLLIALAGASSLSAQGSAARPADQSYVLDSTPRAIDIPASLINRAADIPPAPGNTSQPSGLTQPDVQAILATGLAAFSANIRTDTYYVLHLVQHLNGTVGSTRDSWYVFACDWLPARGPADGPCGARSLSALDKLNTPHWAEQFKRARMFGAKGLSFVYVHYNVPVGKVPDGEDPRLLVGPNRDRLAPLGDSGFATESAFLPIKYTIDVTHKTPIILDNLKTVLGAFGLTGASALKPLITQYRALVGAKLDMRIDYVPSNVGIAGQRGEDRTNIGSKEFDNEGRYRIDFGFAIPLSKIEELKLDAGNSVVPRPGEKSSIYGMVSVFPLGRVDTKAEKAWFRAPQIMYGMALTSKPWDNHLFAVGFLTKYVQPFVGISLVNKQVSAPTNTDPGLKWSTSLAYGIHVPASTLTTFVKSAAKK